MAPKRQSNPGKPRLRGFGPRTQSCGQPPANPFRRNLEPRELVETENARSHWIRKEPCSHQLPQRSRDDLRHFGGTHDAWCSRSHGLVAGKLQEANPDFQLRGEEDPSILGLGSGKWPYWPNGKPAIFDISPLQTRDGGVATAMNPPDGILGYFAEIAF